MNLFEYFEVKATRDDLTKAAILEAVGKGELTQSEGETLQTALSERKKTRSADRLATDSRELLSLLARAGVRDNLDCSAVPGGVQVGETLVSPKQVGKVSALLKAVFAAQAAAEPAPQSVAQSG